MWEKQDGAAPAGADREQERARPAAAGEAEREDGLLLMQLALCAAIALAVWACRAAGGPVYDAFRTRCGEWLSQGVQFTTDTPIARFGAETVEVLRESVQAVLAGLEETQAQPSDAQAAHDPWAEAAGAEGVALAAGGLWPVQQGEDGAPAGASLQPCPRQPALQAPVSGALTSGYGWRENPVTGQEDFHAGVDIACAAGTPVGACLEGQVADTGWNEARGNYLVLRHGDGVQTLYQHMSCIVVRPGQAVAAGQTVGMAGSTGLSTGPHVHLELTVDGTLYDPLPGLPEALRAGAA